MEQEPIKKSTSPWRVALVIAIIVGGYFGLAWVLRTVDSPTAPQEADQQETDEATETTAQSGVVDQDIVGEWDTGCLVPDPDSKWAERHTFTISSDGTANHKRYSGESCGTLAVDHDDDITYVIPEKGKINLTFVDLEPAGGASYDIYSVAGGVLKFGHGFCNCTPTDGNYGGSEAERFTRLNNFLAYKKQ